MKLSRSTGYAVLAVGYIAQHQSQGIILSQAIAEAYDIPLEYLLKILQQLVRADILRSKRGPRGGFSLGKATNKISLLDILEAVDGPMTGHLHLAQQAKGQRFSVATDKVYQKAITQARSVFAKAKVSALLGAKK